MSEPLLLSRQRAVLCDLEQTIADRARAEPAVAEGCRSRQEAAEADFQESLQRVIRRFEAEKSAAQAEFDEVQNRVTARCKAEFAAQDKELNTTRLRVTQLFEDESTKVRTEFQETRWAVAAVFEAEKNKAEATFKETREQIASGIEKVKAIHEEAKDLLYDWRQYREVDKPAPTSKPDRMFRDALRQLQECLDTIQGHLEQLKALSVPRLFKGNRILYSFLGLLLLVIGLSIVLAGSLETWIYILASGTAAVLGFGGALVAWLYFRAKRQTSAVYEQLYQAIVDAEAAWNRAREQAREAYQQELGTSKKRYDRELKLAGNKYKQQRVAQRDRRDADLQQAQERYQQLRANSTERRDAELQQAHAKFQEIRAEVFGRYETDSHQVHQHHFQQQAENKQRHEQEWQVLADAWKTGMTRVGEEVADIRRECSLFFPGWGDAAWHHWTPPVDNPPVLRFGEYRVDRATLPNGIPADARLQVGPAEYALPALVGFPRGCNVLLHASDMDRTPAMQVLQTLMLRLLTSVPPGKVRFTILDPVGRGENFAAFMHLADYLEQLVNNRIWTELPHIEQRLADLTAHMETVIQKYLRNQYQTIEEYNAQAGEVAEPFRILVVANFPVNFSTDAARRLISIASSGARCGVYTLITVDPKQLMPQGVDLKDLEQCCVNLDWREGRAVWRDPDLGRFPLTLDAPPDADFATRILHVVGARAREANRVEVPFEFIAPAGDQWWTSDSRSGIVVPLGRAGATKRQHLQLGKGTSQHVVIAGKTGSGKSTLLHALITNLALFYSPEEVEFYLIDFKKGVEFKTYATHELPHARVVAIESEREFGLSVLQRLDGELRARGEKFREVGAQDVQAYRQARPDAHLPRILLIVDEFQEFFVEDDRLAQEAAQLFDRLVRQGRAFGMHVLLGSQTLGGAYSLARSTIDQMAVRIALQCSEADAHLILSDDNAAARLLSRPGEAIYNDANGLVEGNNPFQVVWLPETRREKYLQQILDMDATRRAEGVSPRRTRHQIVFEGNAPADIRKNPLLTDLLQAPEWPESPKALHAWLGEAIAIKDPTEAVFRPQTGSHLLLIGQQDEAALGIFVAALVSLAAQHSPDGARFYVADASPSDAPHAGLLARLTDVLPHPLRVVSPRDLPAMIGEVAAAVNDRQQTPDAPGPTLYLFLFGLHRFRDLRRAEDDYSFGRSDEPPSPPQQLAAILREGSALRVHVTAWCDTLTNVTRCIDRQGMREFEMRVLFQMSAADSSTLTDNPAASRIGANRALFHSEEQGRLEKFRPYGPPTDDWLDEVRRWLRERAGVLR